MAYIVGLTGGMGSGKSTVCGMLAERGATIIDADAIVHELQRPGTEVFREMTDALGDEIVAADGTLDRAKVAGIVFADPDKLKALEAITHPRVGERVGELLAAAGPDDIVVMDIPLMAERPAGSRRFADTVIVVDAAPATQIARLEAKGIARADAEARMAAQASREERLKLADHVLVNDGAVDELAKQVDELWHTLRTNAREKSE